LKIAFIAPFLYRYQRGIERSCTHLANALCEFDQQVSILAWDYPGRKTASPLDRRIQVIPIPDMRYYQANWASFFYLYQLMHSKPDVVIIFFAGYGEAQALRFARRLRSFQVCFIAGYPIEQVPHRFEEFKYLHLDRILDHIVVKSPFMAAGVGAFFTTSPAVIPNGIDTDLFCPARESKQKIRRELGIPEAGPVLLTVAALEARKGVQHVIRCLQALSQSHPNIHYLVVGDGPDRGMLEEIALKENVSDKVIFSGAVQDVLPYYQAADIFLLLSSGEGFPNALLEAWAMELTVIVSKHPPYPDIIPQDCGTMVDETQLTGLTSMIASFLDSPEERQRIGKQARQHVLKENTWNSVATRYLGLF
jgi:glycosyltransferase involved in cell wall biosynthesis